MNISTFSFSCLLKISSKHGVSFQIDDLYSIFTGATQGMIFYQIRKSHTRKKVEVHGLDDKTNQVFRKLYSTSIISSYKNEDQTLSVYISESAIRLLDLYSNIYLQRFIDDLDNLDWNNIHLPEETDINNVIKPDNE
ncbi:hypothetical protein [Companilactobacillus kedongensis]|uniref:hypothetical protein n=1 Tax=Companilactobacillus kedongensis TaxID=2486004 RepID=UPI000F7B4F0F|nr:hypothetical protein [Companilactobacillus kedongensis]